MEIVKRLKFKILLLFAIIFPMLLFFQSCIDDIKDFENIKNIKMGDWKPEIAVPLIHAELSIFDFVKGVNYDSLYNVGSDNMVSLIYKGSSYSAYAKDYINIPNQNFSIGPFNYHTSGLDSILLLKDIEIDSTMTHDYYAMQRWFGDDVEIPQVVEQFENEIENFDLRKENTVTSAVYKAVFNILVKKGARDFITFDLPEYSILEDHHIVPRSWGLEQGLRKNIDTILNRTPLSKKTNQQVIADYLPNVYLREMFEKAKNKDDIYQLLESHLISKKATEILMRDNFSPKDFEEFIEERQKTIIQEVKSLLGIGEKKPSLSILGRPSWRL